MYRNSARLESALKALARNCMDQKPPRCKVKSNSARLKSALKALARNCMESKTASLQGKIKLSVCQTRLAARQNQIVSISNTRQNQTVRISARKSCMDHNFLGGKEEQRARISRCHYAKFGEGLHT